MPKKTKLILDKINKTAFKEREHDFSIIWAIFKAFALFAAFAFIAYKELS